jgi:hypothetical protein
MKFITLIPLSFWAILAALIFVAWCFGLWGVVIFASIAALVSLAGIP